jgi:hypothetical protein
VRHSRAAAFSLISSAALEVGLDPPLTMFCIGAERRHHGIQRVALPHLSLDLHQPECLMREPAVIAVEHHGLGD